MNEIQKWQKLNRCFLKIFCITLFWFLLQILLHWAGMNIAQNMSLETQKIFYNTNSLSLVLFVFSLLIIFLSILKESEKISAYIKQSKINGMTEQELRENLIKIGMKKSGIDQALKNLKNENI